MIVLNTTSDIVQITTTTANALDVHVTYVDNVTAAPYTSARQNTAIASSTTTTVLSSPAASTQRQLKVLTAVAKGGANAVTPKLFDGTTTFNLFGNGISLLPNETLSYEDARGWFVLDALGQVKQVGATGPTGPTGSQGLTGPAGFAYEPEEPQEPLLLRGIQGPVGGQGPQGVNGPPGGFGSDGDDGADPMMIPGVQGLQGIQGPTGITGSQGAPGFAVPGADPEEPEAPWVFGSGFTQLTGPVTAGPGAGPQQTAISPNAVALTNLAQIATLTLLGNNTGGTANVLALTEAQVKTLLAIAFGDVSGTLAATQFPALTGAVTSVAGALATSVGTIPGRLLRAPQILTSGTSITHAAGTNTIVVEGVGGGGAGGGAGALAGAIGGNGGSGTYGRKTFTSAAASSTFVIGSAGAGSSGAAGGNGTNSTFTNNAVTMTLPLGSGGAITAGAATVATAAGGAGGGAATNADFSINGQAGGAAMRPAAAVNALHSGPGGSNPLGQGGASHATAGTVAAGSAATGFGAGGSGVLNGSTAVASAGANGTAGAFIVWEFA
jgi:hypothetical protein